MASEPRSAKSLRWILLFLALAAVLAGLQVWNAMSFSAVVSNASTTAGKTTLKDELEREKMRQELIGKRIENDAKGELPIGLSAGLSAAIAALATILGVILALRGYLDARENERQDRLDASRKELGAREKDRQDRLNTALNETLGRLVSEEWRQRVVGAAGLLPFFAEDRADFHRQALAALVAAARIQEDDAAVRQGIRLAVERAMRSVDPGLLAEISWQGVRLPDVNLTKTSLAGLDLRDSVLENARLSGANLSNADLTAARLQGARLDGARLAGANLSYADLAGASLAKAVLTDADLSNAKVLDLDLDGADLRSIRFSWSSLPWDATRNWRQAQFDESVRTELERVYGPATPKLRVLMLMWEIPPMVAGGTWTACYHLVRNLQRRGLDVTIAVPWTRTNLILEPPPFGVSVPIITLDIEVPAEAVAGGAWSPYGTAVPVPYTRPSPYSGWSPYGGSASSPYGWSPYGGGGALWSGYASAGGSPYGAPYSVYGAGSLSGSVLYRLINAFRERLAARIATLNIDVIHAHDWVTFDAARAASERIGVPWIAHFHSIEADRQPGSTDPLTERIEQVALATASRVVAVSNATSRALTTAYGARRQIDVVPNSFSEGMIARPVDMGRFETHRVIFLGRLSRQKGVDRFCELAGRLRNSHFSADFVAYGDGPDRRLLSPAGISSPGPLGWDVRGSAFRGASVLVVPSRSEPFGMVILEAMQHRVPVIYPAVAGAAEVLQAGVKASVDDVAALASNVMELLGDIGTWEKAVEAGVRDIERYARQRYEDRLIAVWSEAKATHVQAAPASP